MTDNSILMPTSEHAISFQEAVEEGFTKRHALPPEYPIDIDPEIREKVLSNKFYIWLTSTQEFQRVFDYLINKGLVGEFRERRKIEIAKCVSHAFLCYGYNSAKPKSPKRTPKSTSSKALKSVNNHACTRDSFALGVHFNGFLVQ